MRSASFRIAAPHQGPLSARKCAGTGSTCKFHARARSTVARSRGMELTDSDLEYVDQSEIDKLDLAYPTSILSTETALKAMVDSVHEDSKLHFKSFYSSVLGGIVTHQSLMTVPMDDHMVHRGHSVFDTAIVAGGHVYQLEQHLDRFMKSAESAKIPLPTHRAQMRRIILDTAAASRCQSGLMRYWLSAGRGGFTLSGKDTLGPEFYCIFYNGPYTEPDITKGWKVQPSTIPNKPGIFSELKSTNYIQNALNLMEAQDAGCDQGIFMNSDGTICEGPNLNFAFIKDGIVRTSEFKECLAGCTMQRVIDLIPEFSAQGLLEGITAVEQGPITVKELSEADEAFMTGGSVPVMAVTHWDGRKIGDGTVGVQALAIRQMILNDMIPVKDSGQHTEIPYGMLTGMLEDL